MTDQHKHIDPALKFFHDIPLMITSNLYLKHDLGNGTRCIGLSIQLKKDCVVYCKKWDSRLIHTVSCLDIEYMACETIPENKNGKTKMFKLQTEKENTTISIKIADMKHKMRVKMVQFGVNSNKTTTVHKLQGVLLNRMVIGSWSYKFPN